MKFTSILVSVALAFSFGQASPLVASGIAPRAINPDVEDAAVVVRAAGEVRMLKSFRKVDSGKG
jgi:hypothetical protein